MPQINGYMNNWIKLVFIGGIITILVLLFNSTGNITSLAVKENNFCGDNICSERENKCNCHDDCGTCSGVNGCSESYCNNLNECVASELTYNCCGNNKCELKETCNSCSSDCGQCTKINSFYEAINKIKSKEEIVDIWESSVKEQNCEAKYLDISTSVYFVSRATISQNLVECNKLNNFENIIKITNSENKEFNIKLEDCDKSLIEYYNKAIRGYDSSNKIINIDNTCDDCDDFYAVHFGCINVDTNQENLAFGIVDTKTGNVYW